MLRKLARAILWIAVRDYWNGWLYVIEPGSSAPTSDTVQFGIIEDVKEISQSAYEELRRLAWQDEQDTVVFGAWVDGELVAVCWFQSRQTYRRRGGLFRLADDEAELAQITTAATFRGRGIAGLLIQYAAARMRGCGFRRLYAKIWRDNVASIRTFERAGWRLQKRFCSLRLRGRKDAMLFTLPTKRSDQA